MTEQARTVRQAGFSLIELILVMAIILTVSAIAVPSLINVVADVRLRSSAGTLQGQIQQLRMRAVRDNKPYQAKMVTQSGSVLMYMDLNGNGSYDSTEPASPVARDVTLVTSGAPTMPTATLDVSTFVVGSMSNGIYFNARGLPCDTSVNAACNTQKGYVYYLSQARTASETAWAAVTITPAGRVKTWRWTGSVWQ